MNNPFIILIAFPFMVMLFWKNYKINTFTFLHTIIVGIIIANAWETHNFLQRYEWIFTMEEFFRERFYVMLDLVFAFIVPLLAIWNYQWWFIGKEKDRLFSHSL